MDPKVEEIRKAIEEKIALYKRLKRDAMEGEDYQYICILCGLEMALELCK